MRVASSGILLAVLFFIITQTPTCGLNSDMWVATDALGRRLPSYADCGPPRSNKTVGAFYFLWHGTHGTPGPYDITQILAANPTNPQYGERGNFHWWGEPESGYFRASDPWVARRNLSMLADAGVDVLIFDITNGWTYKNEYFLILQIASEMKANGQNVPKIAFMSYWINEVVVTVYSDLYSKGLYSDLWFYWDGKPLWLGNKDGKLGDGSDLPQNIKDFFTWRQCWFTGADNYSPGNQKWIWGSNYPQSYGWVVSGVPEETAVSPATHPISNTGRSCHFTTQPPIDQYKTTATAGNGIYFTDQWERALQLDPEFIFITGWNEWVAGRHVIPDDAAPGTVKMLGEWCQNGDSYFIDSYNHEYSRDIEPMKDGHTDNYYYQMIANIRKYKGVHAPTSPSASKTITIDGAFSDWDNVQPDFLDTTGDTANRSHAGWGSLYYTNGTGRNDIVKSKVTRDANNIYFYAQTRASLSGYTQGNWMLLFIDADCNAATGWNGYDYMVNYSIRNATTTSLMKHGGSGWNWNHVGDISYRMSTNKIELSIPRTYIGKTQMHVAFDFKWADNVFNAEHPAGSISAFFVNGDAAPNRRFNYRYATFTPGYTWEYIMDGNLEGWWAGNSVGNLRVSGGSMLGNITGGDPYVIGPRYPDIDATNNRYVYIRLKCTVSGTALIYWGTTAQPYHVGGRERSFSVVGDGQFRDYVIDMKVNAQWTGSVNTLRLDPAGSSGSFEVDFIRVLPSISELQPDTTPPTNCSVVINSGAEYTKFPVVTLALNAIDTGTGIKEIRLNNGGDWTAWQSFSYSMSHSLSLTNGLRTVTVEFKDGAGNVSSASDSIFYDSAPPVASAPTPESAYCSTSAVTFNWNPASDGDGSGVSGYGVQVGTSPGAYNVLNTNLGDVHSVTVTGSLGVRYYCRIRGIDQVGNIGAWSPSSTGTMPVSSPGINIPTALALPDGQTVGIPFKPVTGVYNNFLYVEEPDRSGGIRVTAVDGMFPPVVPGSLIEVGGTLFTNPTGERYISGVLKAQ